MMNQQLAAGENGRTRDYDFMSFDLKGEAEQEPTNI